jgi:hypothetical protein
MGCISTKKMCLESDDEPVMVTKSTQAIDEECSVWKTRAVLMSSHVARLENELALARAEASAYKTKYWRLRRNELVFALARTSASSRNT